MNPPLPVPSVTLDPKMYKQASKSISFPKGAHNAEASQLVIAEPK